MDSIIFLMWYQVNICVKSHYEHMQIVEVNPFLLHTSQALSFLLLLMCLKGMGVSGVNIGKDVAITVINCHGKASWINANA